MGFHPDIGILVWRYRHGSVAHWTVGRNTVVLGLIVIGASMVVDFEVALAVPLLAVSASEGQEVDKVAVLV